MSDHYVEITIEDDYSPRYNFFCNLPDDAFCHLACDECEGWNVDHDETYDHKLKNYGQCTIAEFLNNDDASIESHSGKISVTVPIAATWEGDCFSWTNEDTKVQA